MANALTALQSLATGPRNAGNPTGDVANRLRQEQILQELKRNIELQKGAPGISTAGATNADIADTESEMAASPDFGTAATADANAAQKKYESDVNYNLPSTTQQRNEAADRALGLARAPAEATAKGNLAVEQLKADEERKQQDAMVKLFGMGGTGGGSGASGQPGSMKPSIDAKGRISATMVPTPPQQLSQEHGAQVGLAQIPKMRQIVDTLAKHGALGPVMGRVGSAAVGSGADAFLNYLGVMTPEAATAFNDFKNQASLMKSNMAMVHGGARGGSNIGMAQRFDQLVNTAQTPAALHGAMDTFERWLTMYANAKSSKDLDAADALLGIQPEASGAASSDPSTWEKVQ